MRFVCCKVISKILFVSEIPKGDYKHTILINNNESDLLGLTLQGLLLVLCSPRNGYYKTKKLI